MTLETPPKLEAPGKGLPLIEGLIARFLFGGILSKRDSAETNLRRFEKLNQKILKTVETLSLEQLHKKVLVPRLRGIEDSSRYWSIAETLEHIEIVGEKITPLIEMLVRKEVPNIVVNIADYKPQGKYNGQDPRPAFQKFSQETLTKLQSLPIAHEKPYFNHPWLGDFSALQWLWILGGHSGIHYNQIKHILN